MYTIIRNQPKNGACDRIKKKRKYLYANGIKKIKHSERRNWMTLCYNIN